MKTVNTGTPEMLPLFGVEGLCTSKNRQSARKDRSCKICPRCMRTILLLSLFSFLLTSAAEILWVWSSDRISASFRRSRDSEFQTFAKFVMEEHIQSSFHDISKALSENNPDSVKRFDTGLDDEKDDKFTNFSLIIQASNSVGVPNPLGLSDKILVYIYELPLYYNEDWLSNIRCSSHLFAAEVALHHILLNTSVRTINPEDADFFFLPVYVSCNFSTQNGFPSVQHARALLQSAIELISEEMPYWNRSNGRDHIFVATHDFGACFHTMEDVAFAAGIPSFLENSIILQTFAKRYENPCQKADFIQIPPYVSPHRSTMEDLAAQTRDIWVFFRGKLEIHPKNISGHVYSRGVRTRIWRRFWRDTRFYIKRKKSENYQREMLRSTFCLCPLGWAPWSPRIVESVIYGCVPVIIADSISLPFSDAITWNQISLTVAEKDIENLDTILAEVSRTNLTIIQGHLWKEPNRRALLYTDPLVYGDATWQILDQLSQKKKKFPR